MAFSSRIPVSIACLIVLGGSLQAAPAAAQVSRLYFSGYLGLNLYRDMSFTESGSGTSGEIQADNGHSFAGALGLRLTPNFRIEAEASRNTTSLNNINFSGGGSSKIGGDLDANLLMANLYYDFDTGGDFQPFIGAGIGYGWYDGTVDDDTGAAFDSSSDATALTWQVGGGLKYRMSPVMAVTGSYRYVDSIGLEFKDYDIDYNSHELRIGLEYDLSYD